MQFFFCLIIFPPTLLSHVICPHTHTPTTSHKPLIIHTYRAHLRYALLLLHPHLRPLLSCRPRHVVIILRIHMRMHNGTRAHGMHIARDMQWCRCKRRLICIPVWMLAIFLCFIFISILFPPPCTRRIRMHMHNGTRAHAMHIARDMQWSLCKRRLICIQVCACGVCCVVMALVRFLHILFHRHYFLSSLQNNADPGKKAGHAMVSVPHLARPIIMLDCLSRRHRQ